MVFLLKPIALAALFFSTAIAAPVAHSRGAADLDSRTTVQARMLDPREFSVKLSARRMERPPEEPARSGSPALESGQTPRQTSAQRDDP